MEAGFLALALFFLAAFADPAAAGYWGWGDTICLLLGIFFGSIIICIVLGFVARKVNSQ